MILLCGSFYLFAQENDEISTESELESSQTETSIQEDFAEPRFPTGKRPKVAKKVGEGQSDFSETKPREKKIEFEPNEKTPFEQFNKSIGVFAYAYPGLSWQQWLGNFGYQVNFSGYYLPGEYSEYDEVKEEYESGVLVKRTVTKKTIVPDTSAQIFEKQSFFI